MRNHLYNVLFLCTGNSARSILAESLLRHWGAGKFQAHSAGSQPRGTVHPLAIDLLTRLQLPTEGLASKSWDRYAAPDVPALDFVITVCDRAASEPCPYWPGQPVTAHWGMPDPAAVVGDEIQCKAAFRTAFRELEHRIKIFVSLPVAALDRLALEQATRRIATAIPPP